MSTETPGPFAQEITERDAFVPVDDGYQIRSITFSAILSTADSTGDTTTYMLAVHVPSLESASADDVSAAVSGDWFQTMNVRLADAPKSTRIDVDLDDYRVESKDDQVLVEYTFACDSAATAADIAKAFAEYVEGTYVESVIPGYEYEPPVSTLLSRASQGEKGGTPL